MVRKSNCAEQRDAKRIDEGVRNADDKALADPKIGVALTRIHEGPGRPWTITSLANTIAMSPSRFAARLREVTSQSPMAYVSTLAHDNRLP